MPRTIQITLLGVCLFAGGNAFGNGLSENRPWQFQTSADRANNAFVRDMIERKEGGFYDSFGTTINNTTNTTINGDQINCNVAPSATGSQSGSAMESITSSPKVAPGSDIDVNATGNEEKNNASGKELALNSNQTNDGNQSASVSDLTASAGPVDASGGATSQVLNNNQENSGNQNASVTDSQACSFSGKGSGSPLN